MGGGSRWIKIHTSLLDGQHHLHPMARGEAACRALAWIDLIGMARWREGGGLKRGQVRASVRFLAKRWNWSKDKVSRFLEELEAEGAIMRATPVGHLPTIITISNYNVYQYSGPIQRDADKDADKDKEVERRTRIKKEGSFSPSKEAHEVFDYWRKHRRTVLKKTSGAPMKPSPKRLSAIQARLNEGYTLEELKQAVDGCLSKDWNVENGYTDIELICRDQQRVEQYRAIAGNGKGPKGGRRWEPLP